MTGLLIFAALAALLLLAPVAGLWPPIGPGTRCFNAMTWITMIPRGQPKYASSPYEAILAQEVVEFWGAWLGAVLIVSPLAIAAALLFPGPMAALAVLVLPLAWRWRVTVWGERQLEYLGHMAEVITAERMGLTDYFDQAADDLRRGYDRLFSEMTTAEVATALDRRRGVARVLLAVLALPIKKGGAA